MKFLALTFLITAAGAQNLQSRVEDLCKQKEKQYGDNFISCNEVDWGVTPFSADYQPSNYSPMTAIPSQGSRVVKVPGQPDVVTPYSNDYPGIKNTEYFFNKQVVKDRPDLKGVPLAAKFNTAILAGPKDANTPDLNDWIKNLQPQTGDHGWEGKCGVWSAWSMDPQIQQLLGNIRDGIICNGVPFTKGELKEIITSLYPEPRGDVKRYRNFYLGYLSINQDKLEDANVALSKLGMLGQGEMGPTAVIELAKKAKQDGKSMMMDRDPGFEIWNQPIKKIVDVAYEDQDVDVFESLTSAEFVASGNSSFLSDLTTLESDLTQGLVKGRGVENDRLCTLRKQVGEKCDDLNVPITLTSQVDVLNRLKQSAYNKQLIKPRQDVSIVKHEMIIEYGEENKFASMAPDKTVVQSYQYTSVMLRNANGSNGDVIRSQWTPPTRSLAEICASPALAEGRGTSMLTRGFKLSEQCENGKAKNASLASHEYFTGSLPPHSFKVFKAEPRFTDEQKEEKKAYDQLLNFMASCEKFDAAVDFLKHLDQAVLDNQISTQESADLNKEYQTVKKLLDAQYIQSQLDNKYQGVQGVGLLKFN